MTMAHDKGKKWGPNKGQAPKNGKHEFGARTEYAEFSKSQIPIMGGTSKKPKKHGER